MPVDRLGVRQRHAGRQGLERGRNAVCRRGGKKRTHVLRRKWNGLWRRFGRRPRWLGKRRFRGIDSGTGAAGGTGTAMADRDRLKGGCAGRGIAGGDAPHERATVAGGVRMLADDSGFDGTGDRSRCRYDRFERRAGMRGVFVCDDLADRCEHIFHRRVGSTFDGRCCGSVWKGRGHAMPFEDRRVRIAVGQCRESSHAGFAGATRQAPASRASCRRR